MNAPQYKLVDRANQQTCVDQVTLANTFFSRLKGLIGTSSLKQGHGLLISPCKQVHTHFMQYALNIIYLDKDLKVLKVCKDVKPWRFTPLINEAYYVLEISASDHSVYVPAINDQFQLVAID